MARLFVGPKEVGFINDTVKEFIKDIIGQKIYYYAVSTMHTKIHPVYEESPNKIFEEPIALDVLAGQPSWETRHNAFGVEHTNKMEAFVQARDLLDKGIYPKEGDFFTYGDTVFEVVSCLNTGNIFGQEEYETAYKLMGKLARPGQFDPKKLFPPVKEQDGTFAEQAGSVQQEFTQQRGLAEVEGIGTTGDVRQTRERLGEQMVDVALGKTPSRIVIDDDYLSSDFDHEPKER